MTGLADLYDKIHVIHERMADRISRAAQEAPSLCACRWIAEHTEANLFARPAVADACPHAPPYAMPSRQCGSWCG